MARVAYSHKIEKNTGRPWPYNTIKPGTHALEIDEDKLSKIRARAEDCIRKNSEEMANLKGSTYSYPAAYRLRIKTAEDTLYLLSLIEKLRYNSAPTLAAQ